MELFSHELSFREREPGFSAFQLFVKYDERMQSLIYETNRMFISLQMLKDFY